MVYLSLLAQPLASVVNYSVVSICLGFIICITRNISFTHFFFCSKNLRMVVVRVRHLTVVYLGHPAAALRVVFCMFLILGPVASHLMQGEIQVTLRVSTHLLCFILPLFFAACASWLFNLVVLYVSTFNRGGIDCIVYLRHNSEIVEPYYWYSLGNFVLEALIEACGQCEVEVDRVLPREILFLKSKEGNRNGSGNV